MKRFEIEQDVLGNHYLVERDKLTNGGLVDDGYTKGRVTSGCHAVNVFS